MIEPSGNKKEDLSIIKAKDGHGLSLVVRSGNGKKGKDWRDL